MPGPSEPGGWPSDGDGWGSATTVRSGSPPRPDSAKKPAVRVPVPEVRSEPAGRSANGDWTPAGPPPRDQHRADRAAQKRTERSIRDLERHREVVARPPERGVRAWLALVVVFVIAVIGGLFDTIGAIQIQGGFNVGIVVASIVGILIVKRSHMFPIVIAPPIVYTLGAGFQYYLKASGGNATRAKLDAATNYLVYGFPAIAGATAAVLIIAGVRLITRK